MPNYTKNTLIVKGSKDALIYFYNRNRISEEDAQNLNKSVCDLSFEKCVTRENDTIIMDHIKKNYHSKSIYIDGWDVFCMIWGTKWDAIDPLVVIEDDKIIYTFITAWSYPHNWLVTVSKIFYKLEFEIIYMNEDDNYEMCHKIHCKEGKCETMKSYSRLEKTIEKYGIENLVNMIITHCNEEDLMMICNGVNVNWKEYYKIEFEKNNGNIEYENESVMDIIDYIDDFLLKYDIYRGIYVNKEFCKLFVEKVKKND